MNQRKIWQLDLFVLQALLLLTLSSLAGCGLTRETHRVLDLARRTTFLEPRFYDYVRSDRVAQREARLRAEQAWAEMSAGVPNATPDYENGFVEGFADYLYRGGEGEPPLIPPRGYWNLRFLNQFGKQVTQDWYQGFRHGAQTCKASGLRDMWTVPTSLWLSDEENATQPTTTSPYPQYTPLQNPLPQSVTKPVPPVPTPASDSAGEKSDEPSGEDAAGTTSQDGEEASIQDTDGSGDAADTDPSESAQTTENVTAEDVPATEGSGTKVPQQDASTDSDPLMDDLFTPSPDASTSPQQNNTTTEDDIFGLPDDVFESSDSFQPDVDEGDVFDFQGKARKRPMSIKAVQPAAEIPTPILLTSGEFEDDLPPPPKELAELSELLSNPPNDTLAPSQRVTLPPVLPRGRPRLARRNTSSQGYGRSPNIPRRALPANMQDADQPMRIGDVGPIQSTPPVVVPTEPTSGAGNERIPLTLEAPDQARVRANAAPSMPSATSPNRTSNAVRADTFVDVANQANGPSAAQPDRQELLLDLPPLQLTRVPDKRPAVPVPEPQATKPAPVVMWLDDEIPPAEKAEPIHDNVRIGSQDWEPFARESREAGQGAALTTANTSNVGRTSSPEARSSGSMPVVTSATDFEAPFYPSVMDEHAMERATTWNPERVQELPTRVRQRPTDAGSTPEKASGNQLVLTPTESTSSNNSVLLSNERSQQPAKAAGQVPRIYLQSPSQSAGNQPTIRDTPTSGSASPVTNLESTKWRFPN